ncbi:MAG: NAD(P)/FAD-dependent oxidoreductase [Gemmatimonadales bacterium]
MSDGTHGGIDRWDAVVVGAGPSGAAAALALARGGASVLLVERSAWPRWKVCGACIGPGALASLEVLGAAETVRRAPAVPLTRMLLRRQGRVARLPLAGWVTLSRAALDEVLVREAERAGVEVWTGARARRGGVGEGARTLHVSRGRSERHVAASVVIDATGLGHGLADDGGPPTRAAAHARVGVGAELDAADYPVADGELHMVVGRVGYVGLVRVEGGRLNVGAAVDASALRDRAPADVVAGILTDAGLPPLPATALRGWRGTPALTRSASDVGAERLLRVGDAAGYVEPFTGEGITWALGDGVAAAALARLALDGSPADALTAWRRYRAGRRTRAERLCRALARGLRNPWLVGLAIGALDVLPGLAAPLVRRAARAPRALAMART